MSTAEVAREVPEVKKGKTAGGIMEDWEGKHFKVKNGDEFENTWSMVGATGGEYPTTVTLRKQMPVGAAHHLEITVPLEEFEKWQKK